MIKAGCILINDMNQIALVYRKKKDDYSFPKGHMEIGENITECALRETEEETGRQCLLINNEPIGTLEYINSEGNIICYMYLAKDMGVSKKIFKEEDKEELLWIDIDKVVDKLSYNDLKEFFLKIKNKIINN